MAPQSAMETPGDWAGRLWTERNWRPLFWVFALVGGGALQTWALRYYVEPDGVSYLDIAWAYARGDWHHAVNAYWSPLFSWILALLFRFIHASRGAELPLLHAVNCGFFVLSIAAFEFLLRELRLWQKNTGSDHKSAPLSPGMFSLAAYSIFLYASRYLLGTWLDQPDILVAAIVFLDTAFLVRISRGDHRTRTYVAFGALLGTGYLAKTFLLPLGFVFLSCSFIASGVTRRNAARTLAALLVFAAIAGPWMAAISRADKRLTFGTVGGIAYFIYSHGMQSGDFWLGGAASGVPEHPVREAMRSPQVLVFPAPSGPGETFPPWYDPGYYFSGAVNRVSVRGQLAILRQTLGAFYRHLSEEKILLGGVLILALLAGVRDFAREWLRQWPLWLPSATALAAYSLVQFESRLVEPFVVVGWIALLSAIRLPRTFEASRTASYVAGVVAFFLCLSVARGAAGDALYLRTPLEERNREFGGQWRVAEGLRATGLDPGDRVAIIGKAPENSECWAQLDELTIIGEIPLSDANAFWAVSADEQETILAIFAAAGAKAAVSYEVPAQVPLAGWQQIARTPYYVHRLSGPRLIRK